MLGTSLPVDRAEPAGSGSDPLLAPRGRFVVGFDGSQASATALRWVVQRASSSHEVVLVGVAQELGQERNTGRALELARTLSVRADDLRNGHADLVVSTRLSHGDVATALAQAPEAGDLLVVGSDKTGYAQGRVYGFRSLELAATVRGVLVVVPAVDLRSRRGVVVGVDDTPDALERVRIAAREAARARSPLLLVHAVTPAPPQRSRPDEVLERARLAAWSEGSGIEIAVHLVSRRPSDALLNLSRDRALLVVGRSRRRGPLGVGTTLREVLINANAPTAVLP